MTEVQSMMEGERQVGQEVRRVQLPLRHGLTLSRHFLITADRFRCDTGYVQVIDAKLTIFFPQGQAALVLNKSTSCLAISAGDLGSTKMPALPYSKSSGIPCTLVAITASPASPASDIANGAGSAKEARTKTSAAPEKWPENRPAPLSRDPEP